MGKRVPEVLLSGNHANIAKWRLEQAENRTRERRPDLYTLYEEQQCLEKERIAREKAEAKRLRRLARLAEQEKEEAADLLKIPEN